MTDPVVTPTHPWTVPGKCLESPAFSGAFKAFAMVLVMMPFAWAAQMWFSGLVAPTLESSGWLAAALGMMLYTNWHILRGKTTLDVTSLQQTWVWRKRVEVGQLAYAKLFRVRGLEWLIAPRLYTRTFSNKLTVFYAASPDMWLAFERLEQKIKNTHTGV